MSSARRAFVIMPFGKKKLPDGTEVDCDDIYKRLLAPAITAAGLEPHRADADRRGGSIHLDMFQDLLLAEFVVADLTMDNPNVWYEIGVRHALRAGGTVMTYAARDRLPFDIAGQRMQRYTLKKGKLDPAALEDERKALTEAIEATLGAWRGRRASPVYQTIPSLKEPDWKTLKVGDVNEFWEALEDWQRRVEVARRKQRPGDILVLADETPNSLLEFEALRDGGQGASGPEPAALRLEHPGAGRKLDPDDVKARQLEGMALGRAERYAEARDALGSLAAEAQGRRDARPLRPHLEGRVDAGLECASAAPGRSLAAAARDTAATLQSAADAYCKAFRAAPGGLLSRHQCADAGPAVGARHRSQEQAARCDAIAAGVGWTVGVAHRTQQGLLVARHARRDGAGRERSRRGARRLRRGGGAGGGESRPVRARFVDASSSISWAYWGSGPRS